jgi:hypothetical protein
MVINTSYGKTVVDSAVVRSIEINFEQVLAILTVDYFFEEGTTPFWTEKIALGSDQITANGAMDLLTPIESYSNGWLTQYLTDKGYI